MKKNIFNGLICTVSAVAFSLLVIFLLQFVLIHTLILLIKLMR